MDKIAEMTVGELIGGGTLLAFVGTTLIQILTKWKPWTAFFKMIGRMMNDELIEKVEGFSDKLKELDERTLQDERDRIRIKILEFADSCRRGDLHSHEQFNHIIGLHDKYAEILKKLGETNGQIELDYKYIQNTYHHRMEKDDFIA